MPVSDQLIPALQEPNKPQNHMSNHNIGSVDPYPTASPQTAHARVSVPVKTKDGKANTLRKPSDIVFNHRGHDYELGIQRKDKDQIIEPDRRRRTSTASSRDTQGHTSAREEEPEPAQTAGTTYDPSDSDDDENMADATVRLTQNGPQVRTWDEDSSNGRYDTASEHEREGRIRRLTQEFAFGVKSAADAAAQLAMFDIRAEEYISTSSEESLRHLMRVSPATSEAGILDERLLAMEEIVLSIVKHTDEKFAGLARTMKANFEIATKMNETATAKHVESAVRKLEERIKAQMPAASDYTPPHAHARAPAVTPSGHQPSPSYATAAASQPPKNHTPARNPALNQSRAHHPSRLIISIADLPHDFSPPDPYDLVSDINEELSKGEESKMFTVVSANWNKRRNCIITLRDGQIGRDLIPHIPRIERVFGKHGPVRAQDDARWYKLRLDSVRTRTRDGTALLSTETIHADMIRNNPAYAATNIVSRPRWLKSPEELAEQDFSSVWFATDNEEAYRTILHQKKVLVVCGRFCKVVPFADRPPVSQCDRCFSLDHSGYKCTAPSVCRLCGSPHHDAMAHASDCLSCNGMHTDGSSPPPCRHKLNCVNCTRDDRFKDKAEHSATASGCPLRVEKFGTAKDRVQRKTAATGANATKPANRKKRGAAAPVAPGTGKTSTVPTSNQFAVIDLEPEVTPQPPPTFSDEAVRKARAAIPRFENMTDPEIRALMTQTAAAATFTRTP